MNFLINRFGITRRALGIVLIAISVIIIEGLTWLGAFTWRNQHSSSHDWSLVYTLIIVHVLGLFITGIWLTDKPHV